MPTTGPFNPTFPPVNDYPGVAKQEGGSRPPIESRGSSTPFLKSRPPTGAPRGRPQRTAPEKETPKNPPKILGEGGFWGFINALTPGHFSKKNFRGGPVF